MHCHQTAPSAMLPSRKTAPYPISQMDMERFAYIALQVYNSYKDRKDQNMGQGTKVIYYIHQCVKNEVVVDRAQQPPQRRSMGLACHHMETIRQENTTTETSQAVERRHGQILERHDLADDCASWAYLEATGGGHRPTTGHYGCPIMMIVRFLHQCFCSVLFKLSCFHHKIQDLVK